LFVSISQVLGCEEDHCHNDLEWTVSDGTLNSTSIPTHLRWHHHLRCLSPSITCIHHNCKYHHTLHPV